MPSLEILKGYRIIYLATPYRKYPRGIGSAATAAAYVGGELAKLGIRLFCPIPHTHEIARHGNIDPMDNEFWCKYNLPFMEVSNALLVAKMVSWEISDGIKEEIAFFMQAKRPIYFLDPNTMEISSNVS